MVEACSDLGLSFDWSVLCWGVYTLVTLPRIVTPYRDSMDGTRDRLTYQKFVTP
jgi:hypothetical protein